MNIVRGRFAPTPSGHLHFGSLVAALGSYLQAKSQAGDWFVRIDDLDTQRIVHGSVSNILSELELFGLVWDGEVLYQSQQISHYTDAIQQLSIQGLVYPCSCSRKDIGVKPYSGTCRNGVTTSKQNISMRLRTNNDLISFEDSVQGIFGQRLETELGDFIINRADNIIAYHLASVVDDHAQGITEVVRGADLIDSTPRQIYLQQCLGYPEVMYAHLPIVIDQDGKKLSKADGSQMSQNSKQSAMQILYNAMEFLGQNPPKDLRYETVESGIKWGIENWSMKLVPKRNSYLA